MLWLKKVWLKSGCCAWNSKQWGLRGFQVPGEVSSMDLKKTILFAQLILCQWQTSHQPAFCSALGSCLHRNGNQHLKIMTEALKGLLTDRASCKSAFYHTGKGKAWSWQVLSEMKSSSAASFPLVSIQPGNFTRKWNWIETCRKQARIKGKKAEGRAEFLAIGDSRNIQ